MEHEVRNVTATYNVWWYNIMIKALNITFEYIRRDENENVIEIITALDGVDLNVKKGQFISVVGHNGSGKSTLAKHINALLVPGEGTVHVKGMDTKDESNILDIRQSVGMIFQNPDNQIVAGVVEEDVAFGPENMGVPSKELRKRVDESLKTVGMYEYKDSSPDRLSGGQKQLVAIAGVLAMKPECIILDEATAMLDPGGRKDVLEAVKKLNREENITVILITHHMEETIDSDIIFVMKNGRIVLSGTPAEVYKKSDIIRECGLEVPQAVHIAEGLRKRGLRLPEDILTMDELSEAVRTAYNKQT